MTNTTKLKLTKFFSFLFYLVLGLAGAFCVFVLLGSEMGMTSAISLQNYLAEHFGITVTLGALTALATLLRIFIGMKNNNNETVNTICAVFEQMLSVKADIVDSNLKTEQVIKSAVEGLKDAVITMQAQPAKIEQMAANLNEITERQGIMFDIQDLFMYKNTNDQEIKDICAKYKQAKLFNNSRMLKAIEEIKESLPQANEVVKTFSEAVPKIIETVKPAAAVSGSGIVKKVKRL